jgi:Zn-dependent protease with chaperone function
LGKSRLADFVHWSLFAPTAWLGWLCEKISDKIQTRRLQRSLSRKYKEIRLSNGTIDDIVLDVAKRAGFYRAPKAFLIPSGETKPDVFMVGHLSRYSSQPPYLFLSQDLTNKFSEPELRAVVALECARLIYRGNREGTFICH